MSKELILADHSHSLIYIIEEKFSNLDGIDKVVLLKSVAAYYDSVVAAEATRTLLIKSWGSIK